MALPINDTVDATVDDTVDDTVIKSIKDHGE